ncbi:MAG: InlB B-repeat-containing protein [Atopobiaceae bacterium]|nr:InlB B-repeat-containing protein [Atopobiaceae bacterium]
MDTQIELSLDLGNAYITYLNQNISLPTDSVTVPTSKAFDFSVTADSGYEVTAVETVLDGTTTKLVQKDDGTYEVDTSALVKGTQIKIETAAVASDEVDSSAVAITDSASTTDQASEVGTESRPAVELYGEANGTTVKVTAPEGALPEGVQLSVSPASSQAVESAITNTVEAEGKTLQDSNALNVTLFDKDGNEIEPSGDVNVTFFNSNVNGDEVSVYRVADDASSVQAIGTLQADNSIQSFQTDHFTIYVVTAEGTPRIATYNFLDASGSTLSSQMVKTGDTLYEPEAPVVSGEVFKGWSSDGGKTLFTNFGVQTIDSTDTINLTAVYDETYYVFFKDGTGDDARVVATREAVDGQTVDTTGVTFPLDLNKAITGWYTDAALTNKVDSVTIDKANVTLYPKVETGNWVTYESNGGTFISPQFIQPGSTVSEPTAPARSGYTFDGWYDNEACTGSAYSFGSEPTSAVTLYAKWTPKDDTSYTIIYWTENANDDGYTYESSSTATGQTGSTVALSDDQTSTSHINSSYNAYFTYKSCDSGVVINGDGSSVVNVYFSRNAYTVTFNLAQQGGWGNSNTMTIGGTSYSTWGTSYSFTAKYDSDISELWPTASNFQSGNQFYGWSIPNQSSTAVSKRLTMTSDLCSASGLDVTANYGTTCLDHLYYMIESLDQSSPANGNSRILYSGKYYDKSTAYSQDANSQGRNWGQKAISGTTAVGTTQTVLQSSGGGFGGSTPTERNVFLYYNRDSYTIDFHNNDELEESKTLVYGSDISNLNHTPAKPAAYGDLPYEFEGWYTTADLVQKYDWTGATMPSSNLALYAKWVLPTYTVTYYTDMSGANGAQTISDLPYGSTVSKDSLPAITVPDGYEWVGWATRSGSEGHYTYSLYSFDTQLQSDETLYPYYIRTGQVGITYMANGGSGTTTDSMGYAEGSSAEVLANGFAAPEGKVFLGWNTAADGTGTTYYPGYAIEMADTSITLYAQWGDTPQSTTLTYNANGGTGSNVTVDLANNGAATVTGCSFEAPKSMTFLGWNTASDGSGTSYKAGDVVRVDVLTPNTNTLYAQWAKLDASDYNATYDGFAHSETASVEANSALVAAGYSVVYSTDNVNWSSEAPSITDVGTKTIYAKATQTGYADITTSYKLTVTAAPLKVTTPSTSKVYDGSALTADGKLEGLVAHETATFATTGTQTEVGKSTNAYTLAWDGTAKQSNYQLTEDLGTLEVTTADITDTTRFTVSQPADVTYDGAEQKQAVTVADATTGKGLVEGTDYTLSYTEDVTNVGTVTVTVTGTGDYAGTTDRSYKITAAPLKVTTPSTSKVYDGSALTADGKLEGLVAHETATFATTGTQTEVGKSTNAYTLAWDGTAKQSNYQLTEDLGTLEVTTADITDTTRFTVSQPADVTYDGAEQKQAVTVADATTGKGLVEGTDYTLSYTEDVTNVGTVTVTVTGTGDYAGTTDRSYKITAAPLKVTTPSTSKVYDGSALTADGKLEGLVAHETATFATTGTQTEVGKSTNAYTLAWDGTAKQSNYQLTEDLGTLEVTTADITDTTRFTVSQPADVTYDGAEQKQAVTVADATTGKGLVEGTDYTLSYTEDVTNVGTVTVTVTGTGDYAGTTDRSYKITAAPLKVTTPSTSKVYDGSALTADGKLEGLVAHETATFATTGTQTEVGKSTNAYTLAWDGTAKQSNYQLTEDLGTLEVTTADITDTTRFTVSQPADVTYDGAEQKQAVTVADATTGKGLVEGTDYTLSYTEDVTNVGTVTVTVTGTGDYAGTTDRSYKITAAPLKVTTPSTSKVYDGSALTADGKLEGLVAHETATFATTGTQTEVGKSTNAYTLAWDGTAKQSNYQLTEDLGTLEVTTADITDTTRFTVSQPADVTYDGAEQKQAVTVADATTGKGLVEGTDYTLSYTEDVTNVGTVTVTVTGTGDYAGTTDRSYKITAAPLKVTTPSTSKVYDGSALTADGKLEGLVAHETATFATTGTQTEVGKSTNAYTLAWDGTAKQSNYQLTEDLGTLEVTTADITDTTRFTVSQPADVTYDGAEQKQAVTVADATTGKGLVEGTDYTLSYTEDVTNVGTVTVTVTGTGDYAGTTDRSYKITAAPLKVTTPSTSKVYDGSALTADGKLEGLVAHETATFATTGTQTEVGKSTNAYTLAWDGTAKQSNYQLTEDLGTLEVTTATLTISANSSGKMLGQDDPALTYSYTGAVDGETPGFTGNIERVAGEAAGDYAINEGTLGVVDNGAFIASNYSVVYVPAMFSITSDAGALGITKLLTNQGTGADGAFKVGETATFVITVTNNSDFDIVGAVVNDVISNATGTVMVNPGNGYTVSGTAATVADLAPKESIAITASYEVTQADVDANAGITNIATAEVPGGENPTPTDPVPVPTDKQHPSYTTAKTVTNKGTGEDGAFKAGETVDFDITVKNTGNTTLTDTLVSDDLAGATVVAGDGYAVNADGTATVSSIAPNTSAIVKATYTVTQADIDAGTVTNAATVTPSDPKVDPEKPDVVVPVAKLTTTKAVTSTGTGEDGTYKAGDVVTYDITVTNTGNTDLAGITVSDEMSDGGTAALSDSAAFDLAAGQTKTITATYTVTQADVDAGTTVTNVATATSKGGTTDPSDPAPFTPEAQNKAYTTAKTVTNKGTGEDGAFKAGETVDFDITVKNTGNTTLTDTLVSDDLAGATVVAGDGYAVNADGTATVSSIAPNTSAIVKATYTVTQADIDAGTVTNAATVTPSDPKVDPEKPDVVVPVAKLTTTKAVTSTGTGEDGTYKAGDVVTYDITVTNTGNTDLAGITVSDEMSDGGTAALSDSAAFDLAAGQTKTITATYTVTQADVDAGTTVTNVATATSKGGTTDPSDPAPFTPEAQNKAYTTAKTVTNKGTGEDGAFKAGETVDFDITVKNTGNTTLTDTLVSDDLAGATVVAGDGYAVNADGTATVSSIAPNTSAAVKATYTVTQADIDAGTVTNAATVTPSDPKVDPEKPDVVVPVAKLTTTKAVTSTGTGEDGTYKAGDVVTYDITVTNTGNTDLAGITVSDEMSDGGTAALPDSAAFDLAAGQTKTITATYTVTQADVDAGTTVTNVATATSKGGTTDPSDPAPFTPEAQNKAYTTAKTVTNKGTGEDGAFKAGETVDFDITVKNTGNTTLTDTLVSDDLAGATVVAGDGYAVNADGTATVSSIAPNTSAIVKATYTVTQADIDAGTVTNAATVTPSDPKVDPEKPDVVVPVAKLTTTKAVTSTGTGEDGTYKAGDVVTYDITVTNTGNTDLAGITVSDEMSNGGTAALSDSAAFDLAAGQTKTITATYTVTQADVDAGTTVTNVATATSKGGTTDPSDPAPFTPEAQAPLFTSEKTITSTPSNGTSYAADETVTFDIVVTNTGNTTLTGVAVKDELAGATIVEGTGYAVNADGTATVSSIAPNTSAIVKATYTVTQADVDAGNLSNVATVTTSNPGTDPQKPTTPIPTTPPTTPVVPGPTTPTNTTTTTTTTVTTNTTVNTVIYPVATVLQNVYQSAVGEEPTPLAAPSTESIDENGTPLATTAEPVCWVHWYIMLGMLVTLVYGLVVLFRRRRYTKGLKNREKHVLREDDDQQDKQGESAPTIPSGAEA